MNALHISTMKWLACFAIVFSILSLGGCKTYPPLIGDEKHLGEAARAALQRHAWPGNVRELKNTIQRAKLLSANETITAADLGLASPPVAGSVSASALTTAADAEPDREVIERALARAGGTIAQAAAELGLSRQALYRRMEKLSIPRE